MTHPSLGRPPRNLRAGYPDAADRLRDARSRLAARALEFAIDADPTFRDRYDEIGLRRLLHDAEVFAARLADAVGADDAMLMASFAEQLAPQYRRRAVPMDDLVRLSEGLRRAAAATLTMDDSAAADRAIDEAIRVFRWHRRLAGDARRRNRLLAFLYKGA